MSHSQCRVSSHSFMCYFSFLGPTGFSLYSAHQGRTLANTERTTTARTRAAATEDDGANRRCTGCVAATTEDGGADASARRAAEPAAKLPPAPKTGGAARGGARARGGAHAHGRRRPRNPQRQEPRSAVFASALGRRRCARRCLRPRPAEPCPVMVVFEGGRRSQTR